MSFEKFYSLYPRRINKAQAQKAYTKAVKSGATDEAIINGAVEYQAWCDRNGTAREFIAHPATWLNQRRWENDYRADDSQQATGAGHQHRPGKTSMAMAAALKIAQKNQAKVAMER